MKGRSFLIKKDIPFFFFAILTTILIFSNHSSFGQKAGQIDVGKGWAGNSINTGIFRKNSLVSFRDTQYIAYYDKDSYVILGKRKLGSSRWVIKKTSFRGNLADAHNSISIMIDGSGYLHMAWDHHNSPLNYCRSVSPGSLELTTKLPMVGELEQKISYPEFFRMPNGNLLFLYRDGGSGQGNLIINQYDVNTSTWKRLHDNLVDGEGERNAYWQAFVDSRGVIHLSWVWRESPDVASNHDICYARSADGGQTWTNSDGKLYQLPINATSAEYACRLSEGSDLINQTSMFADTSGHIYIASYWREVCDTVPQYHIVYKSKTGWEKESLGFRKTSFSLSGTGTRRIPISRPQIIAWRDKQNFITAMIFRDAERGNKISIAINREPGNGKWELNDLNQTGLGSWEPTYDTELWKERRVLNLFVQHTEQPDGEGKTSFPPQMISVLEWKPK